tara:strand:- start:23 stop:277 length:255 start_codon:yes stop_codon:yes gene_type:complete
MLIKVEPINGERNLLKNTKNKAVLNNDNKGYKEYIAKRNILDKQESIENKVERLELDINNIKSDLNNITQMLQLLVDRNINGNN